MKVKAESSPKSEKRLLFVINTPGQAYTWRPLIQYLLNKKRKIDIVARNNGPTTKILNYYGLKYTVFDTVGSQVTRLFSAVNHLQNVYRLSKGTHPSLVIGFGVDAAFTAFRLGKPCVLFIDDDHTVLQNRIANVFSRAIITPGCFNTDMGKKQIKINGYKELAYLHPNFFRPDPTILNELHVKPGDNYVVLRFNSFKAVHDIGMSGFSLQEKITMVKTVEKYARVFISAEGDLPEELKTYRLSTPQYKIHHVLNYAQMVITDSGTMVTEAAMLGVPVIRHEIGLAKELGVFVELEHKYGLIYCINDINLIVQKTVEILQQPNVREIWAEKRKKLLKEKIDVTSFFIDFIENYPQSLKQVKDQQYLKT